MRINLVGWLRVLVLAVVIVAGFGHRVRAEAAQPAVNVWDVLIPLQGDLYLLAYLFIPVWILQLAGQLLDRAHETWLLRSGSRLRWLVHHVWWAAGQAAALLVPWLVGGLAVAAGLPLAAGWSKPTQLDAVSEVVASLESAGVAAAVAWGLQWLAFFALLTAVATVLGVAVLVFRRTWSRYLAAGALYLVLVVLIRGGFEAGGWLFIYQAAAAGQWFGLPIVGPAAFTGLLVGAFALGNLARRSVTTADLNELVPVGVYVAAVAAGVIATASSLGPDLTLSNLLTAAFYGFDRSDFNPGVYSFFLLTFTGFVLLYMVNAEQRLWPLYQLISIRSGSPRRWMLRAWRDISMKALALIVPLYLFSVVAVAVSDGLIAGSETALRSYHFIVNGYLQLLVVTGLTMFVAHVSRSRPAVLVTVAAVVVVQTPLVNIGQTLPLGLNAMGLVTTWTVSLTTTAQLATATAATFGLTLLACTYVSRRTLERMTA